MTTPSAEPLTWTHYVDSLFQLQEDRAGSLRREAEIVHGLLKEGIQAGDAALAGRIRELSERLDAQYRELWSTREAALAKIEALVIERVEVVRRDALVQLEVAKEAIDKAREAADRDHGSLNGKVDGLVVGFTDQIHRMEDLATERVQTLRREVTIAETASQHAIEKADQLNQRTFDALREAFDARLSGIDTQLKELEAIKAGERLQVERTESLRREAAAALTSAKDAIAKSELATEKRFEGVNEFRGQLSDQAARFMPREVADSQIGDLAKQIAALTTRMDQTQGRSQGVGASWGYLVAAVGLVATVLAIVLTIGSFT